MTFPYYPRLHRKDSYWEGKRSKFAIAVTMAFVLLQVLFLGNLSYIFGIAYHDSTRYHHLDVLVVNFDDGALSNAVDLAYQELQADNFPNLITKSPTQYPTPSDVRRAVCKGNYWGAIYSHSGASERLAAALEGGSAAEDYNSSNVATYIWNEARYPTIQESALVASFQTLFGAAASVYQDTNGTSALQSIQAANSSAAALRAFLDPITANSENIQPTSQGPRVFYNTLSIVMPIIQQFFFLMALNGIATSFQFYSRLSMKDNGIIRATLAYTYTLIAAICTTGYIWAFREDWNVNGVQFVLTTLMYWLYMHISFAVLDIATVVIPMSFLPFFVLTWAITNVGSAVLPFELAPGFYKWSYALPAHEFYQVVVQIWSGGCNNQLYRAVPILFAWEVAGLIGAIYANHHRCNKMARLFAQQEELKATESRVSQSEKRLLDQELGSIINQRANPSLGPRYPQPFINRLTRTGTI
jgi:hypothetical protein